MEARDSRTESPDIVAAALTQPPSITVDGSNIYDDDLKMAFYGIEDKGSSALVIGEQTLGRQIFNMDMLYPNTGVVSSSYLLGSTSLMGWTIVHLFDQ